LGRYLVLGMLGQGGMGVVVEAHDEVLDRSVALKLLYALAVRRSEVRLLREAQALARLSHPNVVQVYDIGELDDQAFIAMELVRGRTLRAWGGEPQPWRVAVEVYLQAARGLAAAHAKGLVHRDFKPDNCIIDDEGRVRVLDFGLARELRTSAPRPTPELAPELAPEQVEPAGHVLGESMTGSGVLMGTLRYMSFEQLQGYPADAHSDQYSFCVSLYETIHGTTPYVGRTPASLFVAMHADTRQPPPPGIVVPRRLLRALWRGMSQTPADRWPSMDALIDELVALSSARRSRVLVGAFGAGLALTAGLAFTRDDADPCPDVATALEGTWDADARNRVEQAFAAHGPADDPTLLPRLVDRLDGYANAWAAMTEESCRATFVVRRQSEAQLEHRTRCLERHRNRLMATIATLADAEDADQLTQAVVLPFRLPELDACAESTGEGLDAPAMDDVQDERHVALRRAIDEASTLREAGRLDAAMALADAALADARELGHVGLVAEALEGLGRAQTEGGSMDAAQVTLEQAIVAANDVEDDPTVARAWLSLLFVATIRGNHAEAQHYTLAARAAVERSDDDVLRAWLLNNLGILAAEQHSLAQARSHFEAALALKQAALGAEHVDVGIAWLNLGTMLSNANDSSGAMEALARARSIFELTVGSTHPLNALALSSECYSEYRQDHEQAAIELCEQAIALFESTPPEPYRESSTRFTLAEALWSVGRQAEAREMAHRALRLIETIDSWRAREILEWLAAHEIIAEAIP